MMVERTESRGWQWYHWFIVVAVFVLCAIVAHLIHLSVLRAEVQARLDPLRKAGWPVTLAELNAWYAEVPAAENAATVYADAFARNVGPSDEELFTLPAIGGAKMPLRSEPLDADMKKHIADYLAKNKDALELLHKAASFRRCRFPSNFDKGDNELMASLRPAARLLRLEGMLYAEEGNVDRALQSVTSGIAVGRSLSDYPTDEGQLIRIACTAIAFADLERVLTRTRLTDEQAAHMATVIEEAEPPNSLVRMVAGERCLGLAIFDMSYSKFLEHFGMELGGKGWRGRITFQSYSTLGWRERDQLFYLDSLGRCSDAVSKPLPDRLAYANAVGKDVGRALGSGSIQPGTFRFLDRHLVSSEPLLDILRVVLDDAKMVARLRAGRTALAAERFRLKTGNLPDKLSDLVPEFMKAVPQDPFDGQPLRYRKLARGYVIYSVGEDGVDDGGSEEWGFGGSKDDTFTVGDDGPKPAAPAGKQKARQFGNGPRARPF